MPNPNSRRAARVAARGNPSPDTPSHPRGNGRAAVPRGTGRRRVASVIGETHEAHEGIDVTPARVPRPREAPRTILQPTDGIIAAIQEGFSGVSGHLSDISSILSEIHHVNRVHLGLDEGDEELASLRGDNESLRTQIGVLQAQLAQSRNATASVSPPVAAQPEPPAADAPPRPTLRIPTAPDAPDEPQA